MFRTYLLLRNKDKGKGYGENFIEPLNFGYNGDYALFGSSIKEIKYTSPNTYEDIYNVISNILEKKITNEHLTNYLKHSYKIYKS
jgi:hypothetical protein